MGLVIKILLKGASFTISLLSGIVCLEKGVAVVTLCVRIFGCSWFKSRPATDREFLLFSINIFRRLPLSPAVTIYSTRFNTQKFYILPTECIYVFCLGLKKTAIIYLLIGFYNGDGLCLLGGTSLMCGPG
jgi:hypothetical protein